MRESGFLGIMQIIFESVRDGYNIRRAWLVVAIIMLILLAPVALIVGIVLLLIP